MAASECTRESGTCEWCRDGCDIKPGWFLPGEAEKAAEFTGMSLPEFFRAYLAVDWWEGEGGEPDTFLLSPALEGEPPGAEFPGNPRGRCVFYQDDRCRIHPVKPMECRERWCGDKEGPSVHEDVAMAWKDHQGQVTELLGREPEASPFYGSGLLGLFGSTGL
jgi:Fe-S-cluster containining protein